MKEIMQQSILKMRWLNTKALFLLLFCMVGFQVEAQIFSYTGTVQSVTLAAGSYQIEMWGANGGGGYQSALIANGGKGGYSKGTLNVSASTTYYIYVGGKGTDATGTGAGTAYSGGWNGGGNSGQNNYTTATSYRAGGGGGGTDIRTTQNTTYANRIIVAGGGGGGVYSTNYPGGNGGGTSGGNGGNTYFGAGGTQTAGGAANGGTGNIAGTAGALGTGGNGGTAAAKSGGGGGGGGYYGGGGGATGYNSSSQGGGGGGSSYIGGVAAGTTIAFGGSGFVTNPDTTGNGRVVITSLAPCTGTPVAGTAAASVANTCANVPFTLTLTGASTGGGITYQWQSSPAGTNMFTNITGATTVSYSVASQTTATDYRCVVTCINGGSSQNSNIVAVGQNSGITCLTYCATVSSGGTGTLINNVQFGSINNNSSASQPTASPYYTFYPSATTSVTIGTSENISITIGPAGPSYTGAITSVWIDWNQDGTLSSTEHFYVGPGSGSAGIPSGTTLTVPVSIPVTAIPGVTRMRIRTRGSGSQNLPTDACTNFGSGETEDYNITLLPGIPCSGTITAGTAAASVSSICTNTPFSISLTGATTGLGITYQWQSSPAGTNTFTNIAGATSTSYSVANQTASTDYRCIVMCTNNANTQTSNIVTVSQKPPTQCYCTPIYTTGCSDGDNLNSFVITGAGSSTISDLNTGCNNGGYYDRTTAFSPVNLITGQTYPVQINTTYTSPTYEKASIWIDFNDNGVFDTNEKLLTDLPLATSPSFATANIIIPVTAQAGVHRMRVRVVYNTTNVNACASTTWGETHDYLVNVQPCTTPTPVVTIVSITHNSASVTWSQDAIGANSYQLRYRKVGSTGNWLPATGPIDKPAIAPGALQTEPLSGLDPATLYEVEVVALCGTTSIGAYSHNEFTTKCDPTPPNVTVTNITANSAVINWSPLAANATYEIQWRKVGDPGWIGPINLPNPPANSFSLPSTGYTLTPYTQYEVQVRSTCVGSTTPNPWSSLSRFTTERTCEIPPPGLTILELKPTSAKVQWDPYVGPDATGKYILRYRKVGIPGWTNVPVSTNLHTLTGLSELTKYEMQVANVCSGTPGNYTLPYYFTTPTVIYCQMGANTASGEYISKVTVIPNGKPQMIKDSGASQYTDYTADPLAQIELIQGSANNQLTIDKVASGDAGVVAWIDFDRNGEFDINERILVSGPNTAATATATFSVPSDAFVSNVDYMYVVMRVALMKGGLPVNCTKFDNGEVEDYTVRITKKPTASLLNQTDILIYPNPVSTVLNVKNISKRANYKIYNAAGQLISSGIILNNKVDVQSLINGMYVIDIQDGSTSAQKKFIKE
ncbi:GEVED domain-containing protein [Chryseobacterium camelliae]|uniref:receptor protein-tyrosine kinase n=1 Tax=Chryseobacterium camelliae TaxID=1265445 RepID=A0ABY7QN75_9FLAO|nr:GEVED domain-containing protein [Chryseobacterium camelliae]WBV61129.1 GEVED domain-containing protein [Chryseobacterium camelliae]